MRRLLGGAARRLPYVRDVLAERERLRAELARLKADRRRLLVQRYRDAPWMARLVACQDEIAAVLDTHPHYRETYRAEELLYWLHVPQWLMEVGAERRIGRALDVGCGYGTLALFLRTALGVETYATDFHDVYTSRPLLERHGIRFAVSNIELDPLPWSVGDFDLIVMTEVLEHLNFHPRPTLVKLRNLLSASGRLYLSTPDASEWGRLTRFYRSLDEMPLPRPGRPVFDGHVYHYGEDELRALIDAAGLRVERLDHAPGVLGRHFNVGVALP